MSTDADDTDDWMLSKTGDGDAFGRIFDRHRDRIARHSVRLVTNSHDVDDIVAITFLEAWRRRDQVRLVDNSILPWLLVTATNSAQNLRRGARRHHALLERLPKETTVVDSTEWVEGGIASDALRNLGLADRQVIVLCLLEGLTTDEAATVLAVPAGTVKSRLSRAKQRLARQVRPQHHPMTTPEEAS